MSDYFWRSFPERSNRSQNFIQKNFKKKQKKTVSCLFVASSVCFISDDTESRPLIHLVKAALPPSKPHTATQKLSLSKGSF
jgi:hypothetical protein